MTPPRRRALVAAAAVAVLVGCGQRGGTSEDQAAEPQLQGSFGPQVATAGTAPVAATTDPTPPTAPAAAPPPAPARTAIATTVPPPPPTAPPTTPPPTPCDVVFVGDSVGMGILDNGLADALGAVGCGLGFTGGRGGIPVDEGAAVLGGAADVPANVVLVVLGYHNARSETRSGRFDGLIDDVMAAAGSRLVVWPLLGRTPDCSDTYTEAVADAGVDLQEATARWPNLVLVDYPSLIAAHPEYSENRCPHLLSLGYQATAEFLAGEVRAIVDARPTG